LAHAPRRSRPPHPVEVFVRIPQQAPRTSSPPSSGARRVSSALRDLAARLQPGHLQRGRARRVVPVLLENEAPVVYGKRAIVSSQKSSPLRSEVSAHFPPSR